VTYQKVRPDAEAIDERSDIVRHLADRELSRCVAGQRRIAEPA
jgi:hypothetical protein